MNVLRPMKSCLLGAVLLGLLSCSQPVLEGARLDALAEVASQVDGDRLMGLVTEFVNEHRQDTVECPLQSRVDLCLEVGRDARPVSRSGCRVGHFPISRRPTRERP